MNERVLKCFNTAPDSPKWLDWRWQYRNRITNVEQLAEVLPLSGHEKEDIARCLSGFRMAITPYFASLMDQDDPDCPIRRQVVPTIHETRVLPWEHRDPLGEERDSPVPGIVHRYPDRVLFLFTRQCASYCRHCVRKRHVGEEDYVISPSQREQALSYIARTKEIRDVLLSGGDPLIMEDSLLEQLLRDLRRIPHVEVIRIGTRVPSTLPMRVTPALTAMLRKYHPLWINTQFNHPRELTQEAVTCLSGLADAGIPLGNQSVLLRGVNDNTQTMKKLLLKLVKARVRPYYLYQCDLCEGSEHFRTRVETGLEIINNLTGNISGFALPRFVIDAPGGGGKIPLLPEYIISIDREQVRLRNYEGEIYAYRQARD